MVQPAHVVTHRSDVVSQTSVEAHVVGPRVQTLPVSSHVSVPLHETPSEHTRGFPLHARALHVSPSVQKSPSSQRAPSFALHADDDAAGSQTSHAFVGLTCPDP